MSGNNENLIEMDDIKDEKSKKNLDDDKFNADLKEEKKDAAKKDYIELDEPFIQDEKKKMLEEIERKKRARLLTVPTDDIEVKKLFRQYNQPICLFGEGPPERRNRLKYFIAGLSNDNKLSDVEIVISESEDSDEEKGTKEETWYHRGPESLKETRMFLVNYSIPKARARLKNEKLENEISDATKMSRKQEIQAKLRSFTLKGSQNADTRPISYCSFSPNGKSLGTCSWSGMIKLWDMPDCIEKISYRGHSAFVDSIDWHPGSGISIDPSAINLASSSRDGNVFLWNLESQDPVGKLPKLESRVSRVKFHPSGRFLGTCVHDNSWRLYDIEKREEVLFQEGHSKAVYCIGFQNDGSLAATGDLDNFGRIWDLRTGRCVMFLSGHSGSILSIDWSPNCFTLATGSDDNSVRIWDVRARKSFYTIPAHTALVSGVSYDPIHGQYLTTCSYDGTVKIWFHGSFQLLKSLEGHGQKVMGISVASSGELIGTCSFDRTFKIWGPE